MGETPFSPSSLYDGPLIALATEFSPQNVSSDDSMSHDSEQLISNYNIHINSNFLSGCGGLVVRSCLWGRMVPGSTEDPPCMGPLNHT
ncbi:hypothetical protein AVEN_176008-1 [Araneus ventricosus]|uniref:Uncharacterized protein n=1 Tax=Araneus ventricosus TaxID=182803 RepID=A0A4Y2EMJ8_ARAVE|nr:hypothetical protein AVEN_176008-1 [Araneus ventricosus]